MIQQSHERPPIAHEVIPFTALCGPGEQIAFDDGDRRQPLRWNRDAQAAGERRRVLCSDFDAEGSDAVTGYARLWQLAERTPRLDWLLVTRDPARLHAHIPSEWRDGYPDNIWVGVPVANQSETDARVPPLLALPAPMRFLWCEPMRGSVDLSAHLPGADVRPCDCPCHRNPGICHVKPCCYDGYIRTPHPPDLHWVIAGGDTSLESAPLNPYHLRDLQRQCTGAAIKFYFTQWGRFAPHYGFTFRRKIRIQGSKPGEFTDMARLRDGEEETLLVSQHWNEVPTLPHLPPREIRP